MAKTNSSTLSEHNTDRLILNTYWNAEINKALQYSQGKLVQRTPKEQQQQLLHQQQEQFQSIIDSSNPDWEQLNSINNGGKPMETLTMSNIKDWKPSKEKGGLFLFTAQVRNSKEKWVNVRIMYDTGASTNYISKRFIQSNKFNNLKQADKSISVRVADGSTYTSNQTLASMLYHEPTGYLSPQLFHVLPLDMED